MAPSSKQRIRKDAMMAAAIGVTKNDAAFKKKKDNTEGAGAGASGAGRSSWRYEDPQHISKLREEIIGCLRDCQVQVLIIIADSYSQKSSFLPRYIGEAVFGIGPDQKVACAYFSTHAAMMACRNPPERGIPTTVTLSSSRSGLASLEFMSANLLLQRMVKGDRDLSSCSAVYVDVAHHRTLTTDILLASLLPLLVRRGPDSLRLVLGVAPSADHEAEKLSAFFSPHCSTRTCVLPSTPPPALPVISYIEPPRLQGDHYGKFLLSAVLQLHHSEETNGSILLYLGRCKSVDSAYRWFKWGIAKYSDPKKKKLHVVTLRTGDEWEQIHLRRPPGRLLFLLSPEVPDASPLLHGISYVVDPGRGKNGRRISQQSANERTAHLRSADPRLGTTKCLRLYTESTFRDKMPRTTTPEILTCDAQMLSDGLGKMKLLGVTDPWTFNFIDPPPPKALASAVELMTLLPDLSRLSLA